MVKPPQERKDIKEFMKKFMEKKHQREKGNDSYKSRIDMHNLFIYNPVVGEMEQRTSLKRTCVQVMPRASLCTSSDDLERVAWEPLLF